MSNDTTNRRKFMKTAGAAGVIGVSALAGCTENGGNGNNGNGGNGGTAGNGGNDFDSVNIVMAPEGYQAVVMEYLVRDTNILQDKMRSEGYDPNIQKSFEGAALFASGGPNFSTMSSLEATRLAAERDQELAINAKLAPMFMGWFVKTGGPYDPENTGGVQASVDKLAQSGNASVGIGSWAGGDVPAEAIAMREVFGHNFTQDNNDFNVTTADYNAIPQLIHNETLAAGSSSPVHGGAPFLVSDPPGITNLFYTAEVLTDGGVGVPMLNNWTTRMAFAEENPGAVRALIQSWREGMDWLYANPVEISTQDAHLEQLGVENARQAEFIARWGIATELENEYPIVYRDIEVDDQYIEQDTNFLNSASDLGFVPENWSDQITYRKVATQDSSETTSS